MDFEDFVAQINDDGKRIDKILRILISNAPLSQIYKLLRKNFIKVNGKKIKEDYKVRENDRISVPKFAFNQEDNQQDSQSECQKDFQTNTKKYAKKNAQAEHFFEIDSHFFKEIFQKIYLNKSAVINPHIYKIFILFLKTNIS